MRPLTLALALCLYVLTAYAAEPDNSKSNGATIYEGLALTIADGAYADDQITWARQAAIAADGNNWLEVSSQELFNNWIEKSARPENRRNWRSPEMFILLTAVMRQCKALDMSGAFPTSPTIIRSEVAEEVQLDGQAPTLTRLAWRREEVLWNRHAVSRRSFYAAAPFMRELASAIKARAKLTPRQWGQLANFIPFPDPRPGPAVHPDNASPGEYQPIIDALTEATDLRPAAVRHTLLAVLHYHKAWIERGYRYNQYTSKEQQAGFTRHLGIAYDELLLARQTAEAERCNLTAMLRMVNTTGGGPRPGTAGGEDERIGSIEFVDECLRLARSDRERAEIVYVYHQWCGNVDVDFQRKMKSLAPKYGPESAVAIDSLSWLAEMHCLTRSMDDSKEDWGRRRLTANNQQITSVIQLATEIQKAANRRRERVAFDGQYIDPKAYCLALIARYNQRNNPNEFKNLQLTLAMPDHRQGAPTIRDVNVNGRQVIFAPVPDFPHRDRMGIILLAECPSLEREWWGWPCMTENKVQFEASFVESWAQPGKLDDVLKTIAEVKKTTPKLSAVSREHLASVEHMVEVCREFQTKGVLHLAWDDPIWRDKATHYYLSPANPERKLNLGSHLMTLTATESYTDWEAMELRAPLPQPYAVEFEFEYGKEMLPSKLPYAGYISSVGIWTQDIVDEPQAMFTGLRTSTQPGGVYFTPSAKETSAQPNLFSLPPTHPKADGLTKSGKARVEVRDGHVVWFLDGIQVFDSKQAGYPPMPTGLLRIGMLSTGYLQGTATLGPVTITKLK
jgi:hypothetical protein